MKARIRALVFARVKASTDEVAAPMPGDDVVRHPDSVMDRAFTITAPPELVWPWLTQLGKRRAGWYLPQRVERFLPRSHRAIRHLDSRWLNLTAGDVIPDYGGRHETFTVSEISPPHVLGYTSKRGRTNISWSIKLTLIDGDSTRVQLRLRLGPVRHKRLVATAGELIDLITIAGLAAGLQERVTRS
ncbi:MULTISPECIES: hypothetical protein [unclassified Nocardioides]|uniref:hypothetical protein n=1 Tax=unclassified Nocardioides TaxID=2615069 RepID=UPI0009F00C57|nr:MULTISPECIES: hypothetical protein [unclassified Nocardioides]GAW47997.1 uncharacterized protein PD653B2_0308 [Nocardioides sp. PD653-B2]GAW53700.1 uncharacterized protein PD653_1103 [Nocardioides sp. PD653]